MQEPLEIFAKMFPESELIYPTGHSGDVIGIDLYNKRLILSLDKVIETLMEDMTEEEQDEFMEDHAWEPLEYTPVKEVYSMIDSAASLMVSYIERNYLNKE